MHHLILNKFQRHPRFMVKPNSLNTLGVVLQQRTARFHERHARGVIM